jgi:hypothetical protein
VAGPDDLPGDIGDDAGGDGEADPGCGAAQLLVGGGQRGMPTTWPARFTRAPPLLPGLMAAEVWITSGKVAPGDPASCA